MRVSNRALVTVLHTSGYAAAFLSGLAFQWHPALACLGVFTSGTLVTALITRAIRVDEEYEMMHIALEDSQDAITLPIYVEPTTGVKHKVVSEAPPKIVSWHGQRGRS